MRIIKRVLIALAVLLLLISAAGLIFFPSTIEVSRSIVINRQPVEVFDYVNTLSNFNRWSPWYEKDTTANYEMQGPASGNGATLVWKSEHPEVGNGSFVTVDAKSPEYIRQDMNFMENGVAHSEYAFSTVSGGTEMTWTLTADVGANPLLRILGSMMNDRVGADFQQGLTKLKSLLEKASAPSAELTVERAQVDVMYYMYVRNKATEETISQVLGAAYAQVMKEISSQGLSIAGAPFAIYHSAPPEFDMEIGLPVGQPGVSKGGVMAGERKSGKTLLVRYFGPYEGTARAHAAIDRFIKDNDVDVTGSPWEAYVTDPMVEKDTSLWETDVYYPIR